MRLALFLLCCASAASAWAQALGDPTRPSAPPAGGETQAASAAPASRLQSVLMSRGRKVALIDGVEVALGGKVGEATLVRMSDSEVVLEKDGEKEVLKLIPQAERTPVRRARTRSEGARPR